MTTVGEEFLSELKQRRRLYDYFNYDQFQVIKHVDSLAGLHTYLNTCGFGPLESTASVQALAAEFIALREHKQSELNDRVGYLVLSMHPMAWLVMPIMLPLACLRSARDEKGRVQLSLREMFAFATVVGLALAFQGVYPMQLPGNSESFMIHWHDTLMLHGLPAIALGGACGALCAVLLGRNLWWRVCLMVFVEIELIAFVVTYVQSW